MSPAPFFTVAIPTYNRAKWVGGAIEHVLAQSFGDFELIVSDNASTDDTEGVVAAYRDPRIRYVKQASNLGPIPNFNYLLGQARGEFLVYNQDDDRLLPDLLEHCHDAVAGEPDVVFYGAARWLGNEDAGYDARFMPIPFERVAANETFRMDGAELAVAFLHSMPFLPPALAFRTRTLAEVGGLYDQVYGGDVIAQVEVLYRGDAVCDPRMGGVFRRHSATFAATLSRAERRRDQTNLIRQLVASMERRGVDWRPRLARQLARMPSRELLSRFRSWQRAGAPPSLVDVAWVELSRRWSRPRLWQKTASKLGVRDSLRFVASRLRRTFEQRS